SAGAGAFRRDGWPPGDAGFAAGAAAPVGPLADAEPDPGPDGRHGGATGTRAQSVGDALSETPVLKGEDRLDIGRAGPAARRHRRRRPRVRSLADCRRG